MGSRVVCLRTFSKRELKKGKGKTMNGPAIRNHRQLNGLFAEFCPLMRAPRKPTLKNLKDFVPAATARHGDLANRHRAIR